MRTLLAVTVVLLLVGTGVGQTPQSVKDGDKSGDMTVHGCNLKGGSSDYRDYQCKEGWIRVCPTGICPQDGVAMEEWLNHVLPPEPPAPKATFCIGGVMCVPEGWSVEGIWIDDKTKTIRPNPTAPKAEDICLQCSNGGCKDCLSTLARVAPKAGALVPAIQLETPSGIVKNCHSDPECKGSACFVAICDEDNVKYWACPHLTDLGPFPDQQTPPQWWCLTTK